MLSTPAAITTSIVPDITACAAKCSACCDEPHWRSTEVPGTDSGSLDAKIAFRAILLACSPTWLTQPMMTSSIMAGSTLVRSTNAFKICAPKSAGCQPDKRPPLRPPAVRAAATNAASSALPRSSHRRPACQSVCRRSARVRRGAIHAARQARSGGVAPCSRRSSACRTAGSPACGWRRPTRTRTGSPARGSSCGGSAQQAGDA